MHLIRSEQIPGAPRHDSQIYTVVLIFVGLQNGNCSCQTSSNYNFGVACRFLENMCSPAYNHMYNTLLLFYTQFHGVHIQAKFC